MEIHAVDWRACGLEGYGKPTGYLERQLRRFGGLWEHNRTRELPVLDRVTAWLGEHLPESGEATIVHGDYRLGNTMFAPGAPPRLIAIFDWELATIGDPLADVGYLVATWTQPGDGEDALFGLGAVTRRPGFPTRDELIARYEERSGRSMSDVRWYMTLALWKSAVFLEGSYKRRLAGTPRTRSSTGSRPACRRSRSGHGRPRRADRRLRRRPDHGRLRLLPRRSARPKACRPTRCATASATTPRRATLLAGLETGELEVAEFEPRFAALLEVASERLIDRLFGGMAPDAAMIEGVREARAPARAPALLSNSWGDATGYDRALLDELFDTG